MKTLPYSSVRSTISQYIRLAGGRNPIALFSEVRAEALLDYCRSRGVTLTPVLMKAIAQAAAAHPVLNAVFARDRFMRRRIFLPDEVDISLAMEKTCRGELFVTTPVIQRVNEKTVAKLAAEIDTLAETPFERRPGVAPILLFNRLPELAKFIVLQYICQSPRLFQRFFGTIGVSNLGACGVKNFVPVWLNTCVFGIGSLEKKPVAEDDTVRVARVMHLSLCFNHSVLDGAAAARALGELKQIVEQGRFSFE